MNHWDALTREQAIDVVRQQKEELGFWYVYVVLSGENCEPSYVGKGRGLRFKAAMEQDDLVQLVFFSYEEDAMSHEIFLITALGKEFPLTNVLHNPLHKRRRQTRAFTLEEYLLAHKTQIEGSECWFWKRSRGRDHYGYLQWKGEWIYAHQASFRTWNGPLVEGLNILHSCDNKACFNPAHLTQDTQKRNLEDMRARKRYTAHSEETKRRQSESMQAAVYQGRTQIGQRDSVTGRFITRTKEI